MTTRIGASLSRTLQKDFVFTHKSKGDFFLFVLIDGLFEKQSDASDAASLVASLVLLKGVFCWQTRKVCTKKGFVFCPVVDDPLRGGKSLPK